MLRSILKDRQIEQVDSSRGEASLSKPSDYSTAIDSAHYLANNVDVAMANIDPVLHYSLHGCAEGRTPHPWFTESYVRNALHQTSLYGQSVQSAYARSDIHTKPRLVFVSHEASRTGAPAIILQLLKLYSESGDFECFSILDTGGERLTEFEALSHTHVMSRFRYDPNFPEEDAQRELAQLFNPEGLFKFNAPVCALVNSAESVRIARHLKGMGIPVISLIHEIAAYYPARIFAEFGRLSEKVIFPSEFVRDAAQTFSDIEKEKMHVRGQGLLTDGFGSAERSQCRAMLRDDLGIEEDATVVLNVGTMDLRKGGDLFVDTARLVLAQLPEDAPVYFIWYGMPDPNLSYPQELIALHDLGRRVRFMPATTEIERVFMGGDVFLLTARADPFPCVIHEALACGLPVIAFHNGGGAPELIGDDCGQVVDFMDLKGMSDAILQYLNNPDLRETHAANAKAKIAKSWDYYSYHCDLYSLIQSCVTEPQQGWPQLAPSEGPKNLVIMHGTQSDLDTFEKYCDRGQYDVALIEGRFGPDCEQVAAQLRELGHNVRHYQALENTGPSRALVIAALLKQAAIERTVLINVLQYIDPSQLRSVSYPVHAIQTALSPDEDNLRLALPYLSSVTLKDGKRIDLKEDIEDTTRELKPVV